MNASQIILAIKEFIWDIIGFLIPGYLFLLCCEIFILGFDFSIIEFQNDSLTSFSIVILSFVLGHMLHGVNIILNKILTPVFGSSNNIVKDLSNGSTFKTAKIIFEEELRNKGVSTSEMDINFKQIRNHAMSKFPEIDNKVYTFMFRSVIANHMISISLIFGFIGLISECSEFFFGYSWFEGGIGYLAIYFVLIIMVIPFHKTRSEFYKRALSLPLYYYIAKYEQKK